MEFLGHYDRWPLHLKLFSFHVRFANLMSEIERVVSGWVVKNTIAKVRCLVASAIVFRVWKVIVFLCVLVQFHRFCLPSGTWCWRLLAFISFSQKRKYQATFWIYAHSKELANTMMIIIMRMNILDGFRNPFEGVVHMTELMLMLFVLRLSFLFMNCHDIIYMIIFSF